MSTPPLVDAAALERLHALGGQKLLDRMLEGYRENLNTQLARAEAGLSGEGREAIEQAAHSIRSSAGNMGAHRLHALATDLEHHAQSLSPSQLQADVDALKECHQETLPELVQRISGAAAAKPLIAVVEDNPDNRFLVEAILEDAYELALYEGGMEALEGMKSAKPQLVLMDISLPEMDGKEVLKVMRSTPGLDDIPVIALTAHAMHGDREALLALGFDGYVMKPIVDDSELTSAIADLLSPS